jgi:hypothetical protein
MPFQARKMGLSLNPLHTFDLDNTTQKWNAKRIGQATVSLMKALTAASKLTRFHSLSKTSRILTSA